MYLYIYIYIYDSNGLVLLLLLFMIKIYYYYIFGRFLSPEELLPILSYIYPGEIAYAKYFTCYLMNEVSYHLSMNSKGVLIA